MHFDRLNAAFVPERLVNIGPGTQLFVNLQKKQKTTCITTSRFSYFSIWCLLLQDFVMRMYYLKCKRRICKKSMNVFTISIENLYHSLYRCSTSLLFVFNSHLTLSLSSMSAQNLLTSLLSHF